MFSEGVYNEVAIKSISKDVALRAIRLAMKEKAFKAPSLGKTTTNVLENDDGMWWNNHRMDAIVHRSGGK